MISFTFSGYEAFAGTTMRSKFTVSRFPNQELVVNVGTEVNDQACQIIGTIAPPDENLLAVSLLADTLRRDGAQNIVAYLPYLAYTRQDVDQTGTSRGIAWVGQQLMGAGIEKIITIDVHSQAATALCPIPITSLSPAPVLASFIRKELALDDISIIAPDEGAAERANNLANELALPTPVVMTKQRTDGVEHFSLPRIATTRALIVDDILDTGRTLISCCHELQKQGITEIYIVVTHGLFTGSLWQELWGWGVQRMFIGNSVVQPEAIDTRVTICDLSTLGQVQ